MLYHILYPMADQFAVLNVFRYLSFRTGGAIITALIISFLFGPPLINALKKHQSVGQPIRDDGPEGHLLTKKGTPTMGGFLILLALDRKSTRLNSSHALISYAVFCLKKKNKKKQKNNKSK